MILCVLALLSFAVNPSDQALNDLWTSGNQAYQEGRYKEAVTSYEKLLEEGIEDGKLHFNLGNAYFRDNKLGKAILHFNKAHYRMPGDEDIKHNLSLANSKRQDPIMDEEQDGFLQAVDSLMFSMNYHAIYYLAIIMLVLAGLASLVMLLKPGVRKFPAYVLVITGLIGMIMLGAANVQYNYLSRQDFAIAIADQIDVLAGPSTRESVSFTIHEGMKCQILDKVTGWYRIRLANGYNGWVPNRTLELI